MTVGQIARMLTVGQSVSLYRLTWMKRDDA